MDIDSTVGLFVLAGALIAIVALVIWSRRSIQRIARSHLRSAREILEDRRRG